jgi:hypothetical protein
VDLTNLLNHAQFAVFGENTNTNSPFFGQTSSTSGSRQIQFYLRYQF